MSACEDIRAALSAFDVCVETELGAEITTHCMYPGFEPVKIYVVKVGHGYHVHDGGNAYRVAWDHGRDLRAISAQMIREAKRFGLVYEDGSLTARIESADWLANAILSVANASAFGVQHVAEKAAVESENLLKDRILETLERVVRRPQIQTDQPLSGKSGRTYHFDFIVEGAADRLLLLNAVTPFAVSVNTKYVAFLDTDADDKLGVSRFAVYDKPLALADESLLQQVASVVPLTSLEVGARKVLVQ